MATKFGDEKCGHSNSLEKVEEEEEESLSLSDLPVNKDDENQSEKEETQLREAPEDFNFNSSGGAESEMCAADEVFFQGQILPFRHSISSETGLAMFKTDIHPFISRSHSMDHLYSGGDFSSRSSSTGSSSIRSDHSSLSSGSSSSITNTRTPLIKHKPPRVQTRNQFHSHPSPTPQIRISTSRHKNSGYRRSQKSTTLWSFFQVGLVRTPDIKLPDLKIRRSNIISTSKNFRSRNSNSTTKSTSADYVSNMEQNKRWRFFNMKGTLFGGCKCSVDAVDQTVDPRIVRIKNSSVNYETIGKEETGEETNKKQKGKQAMSRHRTFEWLKQLSVEGGPEDELAAA